METDNNRSTNPIKGCGSIISNSTETSHDGRESGLIWEIPDKGFYLVLRRDD